MTKRLRACVCHGSEAISEDFEREEHASSMHHQRSPSRALPVPSTLHLC